MATEPTPITALPTAPNRNQTPENFRTNADAFVDALPTFRTQINALAQTTYDNAAEAVEPNAKGVYGWCSGAPLDDEVIGGAIAQFTITLSEANSSAEALVVATAETVFVIKNNGSQIGTITFAAAGTTGTVDITTAAVTAGDLITVHAPATADATLADIAFALRE